MIAALLLVSALAGQCAAAEAMQRAERLTPAAMNDVLRGLPVQTGYRPGSRGLPPYAMVHWLPDGRFWYETSDPAGRRIILFDPATMTRRDFPVSGDGEMRFDVASGGISPGAATRRDTAISPDGRFRVIVRAHDLYVAGGSGPPRRISRDGEIWYSFDPAMARSNPIEMPPSKASPAPHWIGNGPWFWIARQDHRAVGDLWLIDALATPRPTLRRQKMALPGESAIPVPELWLVNAASGASHRITADGWDYLGNMDIGEGGIAPANDGRSLYFARMSRDYGRVELAAAALADGRVRTVLKEPAGASGVRHVEFLELADGFLWKSDRDGWAHYYLYDRDGRLVRQVTRGAFSVDRIVAVDAARGELLFTAFADGKGSSGRTQLHRVRLDGSGLTRLDDDAASHIVSPSPDGHYLIDTIARPDAAPVLALRDRNGAVLRPLEQPDPGTLRKAGWRAPIPLDLKAADGRTRIEGMMWLPPEVAAGKRYPVIVQGYPGPSNDVVPTGFIPSHPNAALAELGFVVVTFGQRGGSPARGRDYQFFARRPGVSRDYAIEDNAAALEQLAARYPFVDPDRVGIWGRSGGGFMAAAALLARPDLYKVGVAIAGNHDNGLYEQNSTEFNFGAQSAPYPTNAALAARLRGKLLLVHGDQDDDVNVGQTLRLVRSLIDAGKRFDLLILPGEGHSGYSETSERALRLRTWEYFLTNLKGDPACPGADLGR